VGSRGGVTATLPRLVLSGGGGGGERDWSTRKSGLLLCVAKDAEVNQKDLSSFYPIRYWDAAHKVDCRT
jgi:hypothetical protein